MDADLSRLIAELYESPYWRFMQSTYDAPEWREFGRKFQDRLVEAGRVSALPPDISQMIDLGEMSVKIAKRYRLDPVQPDQLSQIMEKVRNASNQ